MDRAKAMRHARKKRKLTQLQLEALSGVSHSTISRLETSDANGTIAIIELLADTLGISIDEYVGHEVQK